MSYTELELAIENIFEGRAILITGSGVSWGAKNIEHKDFPSGSQLAKNLYEQCGLDEEHDLRDAADTYIENFGKSKLINEIRRLLTITEISEWHRVIFSQEWRTIYTTNYDDIPIVAARDKGIDLFPILLHMDYRENISKKRKCVYINGSLNGLNEETLDTQFKLNSNSYQSADNITNSPWGTLLYDDIDTVKSIFIVGLSLEYDLDLERILKYSDKNDESAKIIIITSPPNDKSDREKKLRKLRRFGKVFEIGVDGFAKLIEEKRQVYISTERNFDSYFFSCFNKIENVHPVPPQTEFVFSYYMSGKFDDSLYYKNNNRFLAIVERKEVKEICNYIVAGKKIVFIHSYFGNGKTGIIFQVKKELEKSNIHIFEFTKLYPDRLNDEVDNLCSMDGKKVLIFENFTYHREVLHKISLRDHSNITLLLTARTGLIDSAMPEICHMFKAEEGDALVIDVNKLDNRELHDIDNLFIKYGFWGKYSGKKDYERIKLLRKRGDSTFQSILLLALESAVISDKIDKISDRIVSYSEKYFKVTVLALCSKMMNLELGPRDINEIIDANIMRDIKFLSNEYINEILILRDSKLYFGIRSSIVAKYLLQKTSSAEIIIEVLYKTAQYAVKYSQNKRYANILRYIISFSLISTFIDKFPKKEIFMEKYYEKLSMLPYFSTNHFFWLQYSMACIEIADSNSSYYERAQRYLNTAYGYAQNIPNFIPFQINNQQARLLLKIIESGNSKDIVGDFQKAHNLLKLPITSPKDDPLSVIILFYYYTHQNFIKRFDTEELKKIHSLLCSEGYNIVSELSKKISQQNKFEIEDLKKNLMNLKFGFPSQWQHDSLRVNRL